MYRIISGKWKGKRIVAPKQFSLRPTTDFAKEGLFNILDNRYSIYELKVLDLFAGIGSISLEFASRGAKEITSVDSDAKHTQFIQKKAEELEAKNIKVVKSDVFIFLERDQNIYDIIFADPPFDFTLETYDKLHSLIFERNRLTDNGLFILEHSSRVSLEQLPYFQESRKFGNICFSFYKKT